MYFLQSRSPTKNDLKLVHLSYTVRFLCYSTKTGLKEDPCVISSKTEVPCARETLFTSWFLSPLVRRQPPQRTKSLAAFPSLTQSLTSSLLRTAGTTLRPLAKLQKRHRYGTVAETAAAPPPRTVGCAVAAPVAMTTGPLHLFNHPQTRPFPCRSATEHVATPTLPLAGAAHTPRSPPHSRLQPRELS
jgi:hypothetical protein